MIQEQRNYNLYGLSFENTPIIKKIWCKCDYCGKEKERTKRSILAGRNIINKDSCGSTKCSQLKREESNFILYKIKNFGGTISDQK